nr:unnamed protein product [Callosobruchus analis]
MDLRSTLTLLKAEAFLGVNPLMKLEGQKWRLSKVTYAIQLFYELAQIINTGRSIFHIIIIVHTFKVYGGNPGPGLVHFL